MENQKISKYIIKIVGLLGDINPKKDFDQFRNAGYINELGPIGKDENETKGKVQFLRDYFYPNFRKIMFLDDRENGNFRLTRICNEQAILHYRTGKNQVIAAEYSIDILQSEIYVFENHFGLFSLTVKISADNEIVSSALKDISNLLSIVRNFNTTTADNIYWHEWISKKLLCNWPLRGENVKADEYSGSKFKLYSVIDMQHNPADRTNILYDIATTSPLESAAGKTFMSPDPQYFDELMSNKVAVFRNWEALALFDSFTCIGQDQLSNDYHIVSWRETYFRIYLYRLFFKYNLYRYNSAIHLGNENAVKLRDEFEKFLNRYNISHISFNFLGNEIYKKTGNALELDAELSSFRDTINDLSTTIQEEKQAKTNFLLQAVTVLTSITSIGPIFEVLSDVEHYLGWSDALFYSVLSFLILVLGFGVIYFLMPEKVQSIWKKKQ